MTSFDFSTVEPTHNPWLETEFQFEGVGIAEFENPAGTVKGHTTISIEETGQFEIEMIVEDIQTEEELLLGLHQLLSSDKPRKKGKELSLDYPPRKRNKCKSLVVETEVGRLVARNFEYCSLGKKFFSTEQTQQRLSFHPSRLEYCTENRNPVKYWVAPLLNFVSDFPPPDPRLAQHPLRIYFDGSLPGELSDEEKVQALYVAQQKNQLIVFEFNGDLGFIEALPNNNDRIRKLEMGNTQTIITSIMVGNTPEDITDFSDIENWFPFIFVDLLSFSSGVAVGVPWIEFRDEHGALVTRYHARLGKPSYLPGTKIIDESLHRGTGHLLTRATKSDELSKSFMRSAIVLTYKGGRHRQSVEDKLAYFCRALEALCVFYEFKSQNLITLLDASTQASLRSVLKKADKEIRNLHSHVSRDSQQASVLERVIGKLSNVGNIDKQFGASVVELMDMFNLPDASIVDAHIHSNPRKDSIQSWSTLITKFRNTVIHDGYFDFRGNDFEIDEVLTIINHLHDILARIILTIIGYEKHYQPPMFSVTTSQPLDWIKPDTLPGALGYVLGQVHFRLMTITVQRPDENKNERR